MNNPSDKTPQQHTTVPSIPWSSANKPASQTKPASASSRDEDKNPSKTSTLNADITWLYIASGERLRRMGDAFLRLPAWLQVILRYHVISVRIYKQKKNQVYHLIFFGSLSNSVDEEPNEKRIQQKLDYLSPVEFRRR